MRHALALLVAGGLLLSACHDHPTEPPTLDIRVEPTTVVSGDKVTISVTVTNIRLSDEPGSHTHGSGHGDSDPSLGHVHVYLDTTDENPIAQMTVAETEVTIEADPGEHTLIGRLHGADHAIIKPEIRDNETITVQAGMGTGGAGGSSMGTGGAGGSGMGTGGAGGN